ncbi:disulfide oxidoreductase, partial [Staphylococcus aureus]
MVHASVVGYGANVKCASCVKARSSKGFYNWQE